MLAAHLAFLHCIKSSNTVLKWLFKCRICKAGIWAVQKLPVSRYSSSLESSRQGQWQASALQREVCKAGALLTRWPLGDGGVWCWVHLSHFLGSSRTLALLPDSTALIQLVFRSFNYLEPWACFVIGGKLDVSTHHRQLILDRLDKIPNSAFFPTTWLYISCCRGDLATMLWAFLQLSAQLESKFLDLTWFSIPEPRNTCSRELIGIITTPFSCEIK